MGGVSSSTLQSAQKQLWCNMLDNKDFLKAREKFSSHAEYNRTDVTCVGWIDEEFNYHEDSNGQCHIGLNYYKGKKVPPLVILSGFQRDNWPRKDTKTLGEVWFAYQKAHPIWGKAVLNKDFEDVYEKGWMFDTKHPRNELCSAIFATRWPTEHPEQCRAFATYVKAGMQEDIAFVLSTISSQEEGESTISFFRRSGHMPCADGAPNSFVRNFLNYTSLDGEETYYKNQRYAFIDRVFYDKAEEKGERTTLSLRVKEALTGEVGYKPTKDIFYTRAAYEKELARKGKPAWLIREKDLPNVVAAMNKYHKELTK